MRVAHVITRLIVGGASRVALACVRHQVRQGQGVVLLTGPPDADGPTLLAEARGTGARVEVLPDLVRDPRPARDARAYRALRERFRRFRPDVVHAYTSKAGFLAMLAARHAGVPGRLYAPQGHIFAGNGSIPGVSDRPARRVGFYYLRRLACRAACRIVALNERDRREQIALGLAPARKFAVVENGVDPPRFRPPEAGEARRLRRELDLAGPEPVVGFVGRLAPEKGLAVLLDALAVLAAEGSPARLLLVGGGPLRGELEARAARLGIGPRVRFAGPRDDVPRLLHLIDVAVLPSFYEAFGVALLEAMAAGRPVVATRVGGVPSVVEEGRTGYLVPAGDPRALAERIGRLLADRALARRFGEAGRRRVAARFSMDRMVRRIDALYLAMLDGRAP